MTCKRKQFEMDILNLANKTSKLDNINMNKKAKIDEKEYQMENYLKTLHKILRNEENTHPNSCGDEASLPAVSGISTNSIGLISVPLIEIHKELLKLMSKKISAGNYETDWSDIQLRNPTWNQQIDNLSVNVAKFLGLSGKFDLKPMKILINEGSRARCRQQKLDASNGELACLIIQLPSVYTGGNIIIHDKLNQTTYDFGQSKGKAEFTYQYVAFKSNVEFELQPVKSGSRILLFYSFVTPLKVNLLDKSFTLIQTMRELVQPNMKIAIELEEKYNVATFNRKGLNQLKGVDLERLIMLKEANDKLKENEKFCFSIAFISVGVKTFELNDTKNDTKKSSKFSNYHTCDCNRCGYDDDSDEDDSDHYCNHYDDDNDDDSEDEEVYEIDENADPSSKSKLIRPIDKWYDADGHEIFQESDSDMRFFNKIILVSSEEPFVENLDEESGWKRKNNSSTEEYIKYMLVMWPKKYENRILIEMDLEAYIRSTYKELLCDSDANFDNACDNLEVIVNKLIDDDNNGCYYELAYEYIFNILESLKFIQDEELTIKFLRSLVFKESFGNCKQDIISDLVLVIKEFGIDQLKHCVLNIINYNKNIKRCSDLIIELYSKDEKEFAFECLKAFILPSLNSFGVAQISDLKMHRYACSESDSIAISLFKSDNKYKTEELKVYYLNLLQPPELKNILKNFEKFLFLINIKEFGYAYKCYYDYVIYFLKNNYQFQSLINDESNIILLIQLMDEFSKKAANYFYLIQPVLDKMLTPSLSKSKSIDFLISESFKRSCMFTKNKIFLKFVNKRAIYYDKLALEIQNIGWKMPNASLDHHPRVEEFLKSNRKMLEYGGVNDIRHARNFANKYRGFQNDYSVDIEAFGSGSRAFVRITKTTRYRDSLVGKKYIYEKNAKSIRRLIN